jgi:hypothetical protein
VVEKGCVKGDKDIKEAEEGGGGGGFEWEKGKEEDQRLAKGKATGIKEEKANKLRR